MLLFLRVLKEKPQKLYIRITIITNFVYDPFIFEFERLNWIGTPYLLTHTFINNNKKMCFTKYFFLLLFLLIQMVAATVHGKVVYRMNADLYYLKHYTTWLKGEWFIFYFFLCIYILFEYIRHRWMFYVNPLFNKAMIDQNQMDGKEVSMKLSIQKYNR